MKQIIYNIYIENFSQAVITKEPENEKVSVQVSEVLERIVQLGTVSK